MKALLVTLGGFSHINAQLLKAFEREFPEVDFETFSVSDALRTDYPTLLRCLSGVAREYGVSSFGSREILRYRLFRSRSYFEAVSRMLQRRFGGRRFDFTVQTQSIFSAALPGCPNYVYTDHVARARLADEDQAGTGHPSQAWLECERQIYEDAAHVFTFGPKIRNFLVDEYRISSEKVSAIGAGASVRPETAPSTSVERYKRRNILFVGVDWERKGGPELVDAFLQLKRRLPDVTLTIVGCSPDVAADGCEVLGRLPISEIEEYFQRASCFCMPSRVEPFGIVFLEAMQFGLPVVSTTVGDIGAIVLDGETGRLVQPNSSADLAQALYEVLADAGTCREMGRAGLDRGRQFTWEAVARRILEHAPGVTASSSAEGLQW
ncbi:hypothetical protein AVO45_09470 [Ruegeria marisrubri]|uniref:Uncharacterized protein n=1 Tax=Ruegeria marisrubri TaxID=1685379 RepID=A0A0X3TR09_9RHOB|nr:hypothetical protein AVO45_09470 [Ruegeria marisrubri]